MNVRELTESETSLAYEAMAELRVGLPVVRSLEQFTRWVDQKQRPEGYRLLGSFAPERTNAVAVAGFRRVHYLAWGDALYIDDLGTLAAFRRRGHADALMTWMLREAQNLGCAQVHLDSGSHRHDAHRFYLRRRFDISSFHFKQTL